MMDALRLKFDEWARSGRAERMEAEHGRSVLKVLPSIRPAAPFSFLDIGCGNGWVVRRMARRSGCRRAVGIDASPAMIESAISRALSPKERYVRTALESWRYGGYFDCAFAMESIYYCESLEGALSRVYGLLRRGGTFYCGTDYYTENRATANWSKKMNLPMRRLSVPQWKKIFEDARFGVRTRQIRDPASPKKWMRELGTLFVVGIK